MKRKITIEIETDETGNFCYDNCSQRKELVGYDNYFCIAYKIHFKSGGIFSLRCQECKDAEIKEDKP